MDTPLHSDKLEDQCAVMNHADMLTEGLLRWCLKVAVIALDAQCKVAIFIVGILNLVL